MSISHALAGPQKKAMRPFWQRLTLKSCCFKGNSISFRHRIGREGMTEKSSWKTIKDLPDIEAEVIVFRPMENSHYVTMWTTALC